MMQTKSNKMGGELIINGLRFTEKVLDYDLTDGVWTFKLDNGTTVITTGSIVFIKED